MGRCRTWLGCRLRLAGAIHPTARRVEHLASVFHTDLNGETLGDGAHFASSPFSLSSNAANFFWASMIASACSSSRLRRAFSGWSGVTSGAVGLGHGPRFLFASVPASRSLRQVVRLE